MSEALANLVLALWSVGVVHRARYPMFVKGNKMYLLGDDGKPLIEYELKDLEL